MPEKYLKVIEMLGEAIINNELKISVLEYENKILKEKLETYESDCEKVN